MLGWLAFGGGARLWSELALETGHKVFYAGHTGTPLVWARQASYRDLDGLAVDVGGFAGRIARALGAHPPGDSAEMAEGLSPLADTMHRTLAAFDACGESPFHTHGRMLSLSLPMARWQALSASGQAILEHAIAAAAPLAGSELGTHRRMARLTIERRNKPMSVLFDRALVRRISEAGDDLLAEAARSHPAIGRIVASLKGFRRLTSPPDLMA
jgi:TRAP-type mannitol/chloroaromatic compound transport system substrate-binding protein